MGKKTMEEEANERAAEMKQEINDLTKQHEASLDEIQNLKTEIENLTEKVSEGEKNNEIVKSYMYLKDDYDELVANNKTMEQEANAQIAQLKHEIEALTGKISEGQ